MFGNGVTIGSVTNGTLRNHREHGLTQLDLIVEAKKS